MKRLLLLTACLVLSLSLFACAPLVKTDLKSLKENPQEYEGKTVVVTTDLKSLAEKPEDYLGRKVELTGFVEYNGFRKFHHWNFFLKDEEGRSVRCYEREYRVDAWLWPVVTAKRAARENKPLTIVGRLHPNLMIELDWIEYEGIHIDTDHKPPGFAFPHFH
jgi:hypothetical protein